MIKKIIKKIRAEIPLDNYDILELFRIDSENDFTALMETAVDIRNEQGKRIKLTSTIHITNKCQVTPKCAYCGFAAGTSYEGYFSPFYKSESEIRDAALCIEQSGIPRVSCSGAHGYRGEHAKTAAHIVKNDTSLELIVNVGSDLTPETMDIIARYGTDTICCNLETTNPTLFKKLKPGEELEQRMAICTQISKKGLELSSGLLIGVGESYLDRLHHLKYLKTFRSLGEIPIMGFNPYKGTQMESHPACSIKEQMKTIAITRVLYPDIRITVPTPTIGPENVKFSLMAGADNLATVIPDSYPHEVKGVGSPTFGTLNEVLSVISEMGLVSEIRSPASSLVKKIPLAQSL